ncbi:putative ATPase [Nocardia tenerifensis]|uniref:Putative ATPase n=1 Tax=Nocardia tenerifensis TaxID=228006 RepID=A0A318JQF7_9NOCA|nr:BTAD domain-containing putative transcriptional regulator [Nocardia tenerifensis]PXX56349.1 putative ATPase [Nocardia tenerifensis]
MEILVLGPVVVRAADTVIAVDRPLQRAALTCLALAKGLPVPDSRLAAGLWGDEARERPPQRLWNVISRLRATLGPHADAVERTAAGYRCTAIMPDLLAAEAAAGRMRAAQTAGEHAVVRAESAAALNYWRGSSLADVRTAPLALAEAQRLDAWRLELSVAGITAAIESGDAGEVVTELSRLVAAHPVHETLGRLHALALYRTGRQADALSGLDRLRRELAARLGVAPAEETVTLEQRVLRHDPQLRRSSSHGGGRTVDPDEGCVGCEIAAGTDLPGPVTSFLGREREMSALVRQLPEPATITLTGGPGCGKSRLALEAARAAARAGRRVVAVQLAAVRDANLVGQAIATVAGVEAAPGEELPELATELAGNLLLIDNAEHVADEVKAIVTELSAATPGLTTLITSQVPLGCHGEDVRPVGALDRRSSLALFADRAKISLDESTRDEAVRICATVDWLPLGIELAAGLTRTLSLSQLATRITDTMRLLVGGALYGGSDRHASLRIALDCSYQILDPATQSVLRGIGVFAGGFPPEAVAAVLPADLDADRIASAMAELEHRNLITVLTDGAYRRCTLLETVRDYAQSRLAAEGELAAARARHAQWCLDHVCAAIDTHGEGTAEGVAAIFAEWPNIAEALDRSPGTPAAATALRLAVAMDRPWLMRSWYTYAGRYYGPLLASTDISAADRADALSRWAFHWMMIGSLDEAADLLDEAATLIDPEDGGAVAVSVHYCRGCIDVERARYRQAVDTLRTAAEFARRTGNVQRESACIDACASAQLFAGDAQAAAENFRRAADLDRTMGDQHGLARGLSNLAKALAALGRTDEALAHAAESDDYAKRFDDRHILALTQQVRAGIAAAAADLDAAEVHCRTALTYMGDEIGTAEIDLADVLIERGELAEARALLDRVFGDSAHGQTTRLAAMPVSAALACAEGDFAASARIVEETTAAHAASGFGWPRYVERLAAVRRRLSDQAR